MQSLGLDDDAMPDLVPDMQLKVEEALKVLPACRAQLLQVYWLYPAGAGCQWV